MSNAAGTIHAGANAQVQVGNRTHNITHNHNYAPHIDQCLADLYSTDPRDDKSRIERTKGGLLRDVSGWILAHHDFQQWRHSPLTRLLWIEGGAGKGKTMLLCSILNELESSADSAMLSYFFCQAADSSRNTATAVLRGLIYLLLNQQKTLAPHLMDKYAHAGKRLFEDANAFDALSKIFRNIVCDPMLATTYLIVDALDECETDRDALLSIIADTASLATRVKWIVSSRSRPDIEYHLAVNDTDVRLKLEVNAEVVSEAICIYINNRVSQLPSIQRDKALQDQVCRHLSAKADGTFLWVALVFEQLRKCIRPSHVLQVLDKVPKGLEPLYDGMMDQIKELEWDAEPCHHILSIISLAYRPLHLLELKTIAGPLDISDIDDLEKLIHLCGSFLTIQDSHVYLIHQSAKEYLAGKASAILFPNGPAEVHRNIFSRSLDAMSSLRRNIYALPRPGILIDDISAPNPDPLAALRYSCVYWITHLCKAHAQHPNNLDDNDTAAISRFLHQHFLHWLESLSLLRHMSDSILSIARLENLLRDYLTKSQLLDFVHDARRFIMYHKRAIESSPLQVYASALVFSPSRSIIRDLFKQEEPKGISIKPSMEDWWSAFMQTLEDHRAEVESVAISHNSTLLASGSRDGTVKIWDLQRGSCRKTLKVKRPVISVAFRGDGRQLASFSSSLESKIWDLAIWEVKTQKCLVRFEDKRAPQGVAFSRDGERLAVGFYDNTFMIWSLPTETDLEMPEGLAPTSITFSWDGKLLAPDLRTHIDMWNAHDARENLLAFSGDGKRLAAVFKNKIRIWNAETGSSPETLCGHYDVATSVAFSSDSCWLASGSADGTVEIWHILTGAYIRWFTSDPKDEEMQAVQSVAFSSDGKWLASASLDETIKIWDVIRKSHHKTLIGHGNSVESVVFSGDSPLLASGSYDQTVKIWDTSHPTAELHGDKVNSVTFSDDGRWLAAGLGDGKIKIWKVTTGECVVSLDHKQSVSSVAFSDDGKWLASSSYDSVKIWDLAQKSCRKTIPNPYPSSADFMAFSKDGQCFVSIWGLFDRELEGGRISFEEGLAIPVSDDGIGVIRELKTSVDLESITKVERLLRPRTFNQMAGSRINLRHDNKWIKKDGKSILYLPGDYRPATSDSVAIAGLVIAIGCLSGHVWIAQFT